MLLLEQPFSITFHDDVVSLSGDVMRPTALTGIETVSLTAAARCTWYPGPTGMLGLVIPLEYINNLDRFLPEFGLLSGHL
ncbi:MAG: hypothetical protein CM15mP117_25480 [Alphaproteobacteria bacterium]|nr:MAG: hypothetical protein CM15mP117_25480 [Alphaproteobacteria bacterium]